MIPKLEPFIPNPELKSWDLKYERKYKIPVNWGVGFKWTGKNGHKHESVLRDEDFTPNGKRKIRLHESNLLYSIGASHYYASFETWGVSIMDVTEKQIYSAAGYGPEYDAIHTYLIGIRLEVERRLTKVEKDMNGNRIGKIGDWTYRFNSEADARSAALATFPKRFTSGWALMDENEDKVLSET